MKSKLTKKHKKQTPLNKRGFIGLIILILLVIFVIVLDKFPFISLPKKQYLIQSNGVVEKVAAKPAAGEVKKTVLEALTSNNKKDNEDIVSGNEFAQVGVLNYYPGGYQVVYPNNFEINYGLDFFEAKSPAGGKVLVKIVGKDFKVEVDLSGVPSDQKPVIEAAKKLISRSFYFIDGTRYNFDEVKTRFSN